MDSGFQASVCSFLIMLSWGQDVRVEVTPGQSRAKTILRGDEPERNMSCTFYLSDSYCCLFVFSVPDGPGAGPSQKDIVRLKKQNQGLMEENYLLKVKIDVLLDMVRLL